MKNGRSPWVAKEGNYFLLSFLVYINYAKGFDSDVAIHTYYVPWPNLLFYYSLSPLPTPFLKQFLSSFSVLFSYPHFWSCSPHTYTLEREIKSGLWTFGPVGVSRGPCHHDSAMWQQRTITVEPGDSACW
jgi:hypothetical protein